MTRYAFLALTLLCAITSTVAQRNFKEISSRPTTSTSPPDISRLTREISRIAAAHTSNNASTSTSKASARDEAPFNWANLTSLTLPPPEAGTGSPMLRVLPVAIEEPGRHINARLATLLSVDPAAAPPVSVLNAIAAELSVPLTDPSNELQLRSDQIDSRTGVRHLRFAQHLDGIPVYGGELLLHVRPNGVATTTGRLYPSVSKQLELVPTVHEQVAMRLAQAGRAERTAYTAKSLADNIRRDVEGLSLAIYNMNGGPRLAYLVDVAPHLLDHRRIVVDAHTGEVLDDFSLVCDLIGELHTHQIQALAQQSIASAEATNGEPARSGKTAAIYGEEEADAVDLNGITHRIQTWQESGTFFLVDATRPMWSNRSEVPQGVVGGVVTANGQSTHPMDDDFSGVYSNTSNNRWDNPAEVSAHVNSVAAYEYFRSTFGRNSIDGNGGTVMAFADIADPEDGEGLDNAFWAAGRMWYGNGRVAFKPIAGGLDVGGHEMAHGVIENTAGLEYRDESGALNESFADVFAVMVDRDDWTLGEDVVRSSVYRSGALRNLANPNNGGSSLNDIGYQPDHYSQRFTGSQDNGGVHINSGIPNRAAYLIAQDIGRAKTEQLYYDVLSNYLTRTSDFEDLRNAMQQAAEATYGAGSPELTSVIGAMDAVGMPGSGNAEGGNTNGEREEPPSQQVNPGTELVAHADAENTLIKVVNLNGETVISDITPGYFPEGRPSITDDGSFAVFSTRDGDINLVSIDYQTNTVEENLVSGDLDGDGEGDVRNAAISRGGERLAFLTNTLDDNVYILDLASSTSEVFQLYTPSAEGRIFTVDFADVIEWDYTGQNLLYDAANRIDGADGFEVTTWDIGLVNVFDAGRASFTQGDVVKLFGNLEPGISVGNPTLSKNKETIMAFDRFDAENDSYQTLAVDLTSGEIGNLWTGSVLGWPNYTASDNHIIFNHQQDGEDLIAIRELAPSRINPANDDAFALSSDAYRGWAYANGERDLISSVGELLAGDSWTVAPNPTADVVQIFRRADAYLGSGQFELYDIAGRQLAAYPSSVTSINLSALPKGQYVLRQGERSKVVVRR